MQDRENKIPVNNTIAENSYWKKRIILFFVMSIMVTLIHSSSFSQYSPSLKALPASAYFVLILFKRALPLFAVPAFFLVSGATFFRDYENTKYFLKIKRRIKTILIPYLIWNTLNMIFELAVNYSSLSKFIIGRAKFHLTLSNVLLGIFHYKTNLPFWFLFALIIYILLSPVINAVITNKYVGFAAVVCLIVLEYFNIGLPTDFILERNSLTFYLIGCIIGKHYFDFLQNKPKKSFSVIALICFVLCVIFFVFFGYRFDHYSHPALKTIVCIVFMFSFWFAADLVIGKLKIKPYMSASFLIFATHINVQAVIVKVIYMIGPKNLYFSIANFFLSTVLTILSIIVFSALLKKIAPKLYGIVCGGR